MAIYSLDPAGRLAENVAFSVNNQGLAPWFYFAHQLPSVSLESTTPDGRFVNVPGGAATLSASLVGSGELVHTASPFVRASWGSPLVLGP